MDKAISRHFGARIKSKTRLTGGYTFQTWLLTLTDGRKLVFRTQKDFLTGGGRPIIIEEVLERERFFYGSVNAAIGHVCPEVYVVDGTREYYESSYCIMEYIEGTPLDRCFGTLGEKERNDVLYKIGETAAKINNILIEHSHPYMKVRGAWEEYISNRLRERLAPLVRSKVIRQKETDKIADGILNEKASETARFLHLDMRHVNMIYRDCCIFVLDAENCEFGDPLFELATIDVAGELAPALISGYKTALNGTADTDCRLYDYYKMERLALVLQVFMNEVKTNTQATEHYLNLFMEQKDKLL